MEFDAAKMKRLVGNDKMLLFVYQDMLKRNSDESEDNILEIVFNTYVLEDSVMEYEYLRT